MTATLLHPAARALGTEGGLLVDACNTGLTDHVICLRPAVNLALGLHFRFTVIHASKLPSLSGLCCRGKQWPMKARSALLSQALLQCMRGARR